MSSEKKCYPTSIIFALEAHFVLLFFVSSDTFKLNMNFRQISLVALVIASSLIILVAADDDLSCRENILEQGLRTDYELSKIEDFIKLAAPRAPRTCEEVCHSILKNVVLDYKNTNGEDSCCCGTFAYWTDESALKVWRWKNRIEEFRVQENSLAGEILIKINSKNDASTLASLFLQHQVEVLGLPSKPPPVDSVAVHLIATRLLRCRDNPLAIYHETISSISFSKRF